MRVAVMDCNSCGARLCMILICTRAIPKVLGLDLLDDNSLFFTIYTSVKRAFFTDSCQSAADVTSL